MRAATSIHYPECWDTAAYPTVESALSEVYAGFKCTNHQGPHTSAQAIDLIIRDICETDPADPDANETVCIGVDDLRQIIESHFIEPAAPVAVPVDAGTGPQGDAHG